MNKRSSNLDNLSSFRGLDPAHPSDLVRTIERLLKHPLAPAAGSPTPQQLVKLAKRLRDMRKSRTQFMDRDLFGEPAWDMILALYISHVEQYRLKVTDLVHESLASSSTALRWIVRLEGMGYIVRLENPMDHRSFFLDMPEGGVRKVTALLESAWLNQFPND